MGVSLIPILLDGFEHPAADPKLANKIDGQSLLDNRFRLFLSPSLSFMHLHQIEQRL